MKPDTWILCFFAIFLSYAQALCQEQWQQGEGYRWSKLAVPANGKTGFSQMSPEQTGLLFTNRLSDWSIATNRVLANGSGVSIGDYDRDGLPDIYFCGLETPNVLYKNLGNWKFKDVTREAGVSSETFRSRGAVFADINGDNFPDLLVSTLQEGVLCFLNNGQGKFVDYSSAAGTRSNRGSMTMTLADIDGNGTLDLYVANNRPSDIRDRGRITIPVIKGKPSIPPQFSDRLLIREGKVAEYGQADQLFLNDGKGQFKEQSWTGGLFLDEQGKPLSSPPLDWGLTAAFRDVNGDLAPDLYVCNDFWTPDRFWINDGNGKFHAIEKMALRKISSSSMGVDFADVNKDGHLDFFVVDMLSRDPRLRKRQFLAEKAMVSPIGVFDDRPQVMRNTLYFGAPDGLYKEAAHYAGVAASDWSWSPIFVDVDLDGYEDLLISAGHFRDVQDIDATAQIRARQHPWDHIKDETARQMAYSREMQEHNALYPPLAMPIIAFHNTRNGRFQEATTNWGLNTVAVHHGMATADLDLDGDLDLVANDLNSAAAVFRNESSASRVLVRLRGVAPNTEGIGAKITLIQGTLPKQTLEIVAGGRYLASSEPVAMFAAGSSPDGMKIEVQWRNGKVSQVANIKPNCAYEIAESQATIQQQKAITSQTPPAAMFEDVSGLLQHKHHETEFNDFERQPLIPFKLSQNGPGVCWFDLDGDGNDDLVIGSGRGSSPSLFRNNGQGGFSRLDLTMPAPLENDISGLLGWSDESGSRLVLAALTGYERPGNSNLLQFRLTGNRVELGPPITTSLPNSGAIAMGDMDGDGRLELFVSGSVLPGQYPLGAPCRIFRNDGREWKIDSRNSVLFENLGIVNGAVWSDLTGDGRQELLLACEWGPIRVFSNRNGMLFEVTEEFGLKEFTGWWKGVATGDLNNDGKLDIVASNWGLNSPFKASPQKPLVFAYGQLSQPGIMDVLETEYNDANGQLTVTRPLYALAGSLPFLLDQFSKHQAFSEASLTEALGPRSVLSRRVEANTLASMVFLNMGNRFQAAELPQEAQLSPAFCAKVCDLDGDGNEDVFLSQNFSALRAELDRIDSGTGLWLRGDGTGKLVPVSSKQSGFVVHGEQRGAALSDFDRDGRVDLVVSQNGGETKLFRNKAAFAGLRVWLKGEKNNADAIGAVMRLQFGDRLGPAREVQAGSGYLSQDSAIQVMPAPQRPTALLVKWPGGKTITVPISHDWKHVSVGPGGLLKAN